MVARHFRISGRVQAVGFRFYTLDAAEREGIAGTVRNTPDGGVEISAEGEAEAMERFERALRRGPRGARVESVDTEDALPTGRFVTFTIAT
ncbi:MAG: acylphosphatase [Acidobacteria bacterium]|nr:acylphosphatase [Acidobacteriota bacterium]MBI3262498.1 acylphosphatase [Acidobacteriota bacterium]